MSLPLTKPVFFCTPLPYIWLHRSFSSALCFLCGLKMHRLCENYKSEKQTVRFKKKKFLKTQCYAKKLLRPPTAFIYKHCSNTFESGKFSWFFFFFSYRFFSACHKANKPGTSIFLSAFCVFLKKITLLEFVRSRKHHSKQTNYKETHCPSPTIP